MNYSPSLDLQFAVNPKPDPECGAIRDVMKVCNSRYGNVGWSGLNEIYFEGDYIISSIAKMNESYLSGSQDVEKQYVMCHEIGHGFGLPQRRKYSQC